MTRRNRTPEENERRAKIRELLQAANIGSMDDIQNLFKETIAEFMENGLEAELDDELGYSKYGYRQKAESGGTNSRNGHSSKHLRTGFGDVEVSVPRDRKGEFEPQLLKKNQTGYLRTEYLSCMMTAMLSQRVKQAKACITSLPITQDWDKARQITRLILTSQIR